MPRDRDISKPADWKSAILRSAAQPAHPHPNLAKRLECVQLAGAFVGGWRLESGSKLHALPNASRTSYACEPREASGVRPACWRFRATHRAPKREQAPRSPCASRHSVAALPALPRWEISGRSKLLRPVPRPISHLFSWRRNQVVLVHFGLFQQELVAVGPNDFCAVHFRDAAQTEVEGIGRLRAVRIACDKSLATLCRENCRENRRGGGKDSASRQSVVRIVAITVSAPRIWWRNSPPPCAAIPVRRTV